MISKDISSAKAVPSAPFIEKDVVCCGGGLWDHPRVYLRLGENAAVFCPYCSHIFKHQEDISFTDSSLSFIDSSP